ncbi:CHAT domain-containing protein [Paractinoplanes lichenicola]|uniref:CHAT domain-containing protein n=1 Tax=Paractinoplanes lichenicola TaxID=2802976 RepID=A0ABS1VDI9_9ACTN|nr:CHAT domain-containing protein [Actinoplanes lichenicola]MBL7252703.1 CHAT domain-containing protein [Actinoplanes lichenicola]
MDEIRRLQAELYRAFVERDLATLAAMPARVAELRSRLPAELAGSDEFAHLEGTADLGAAVATGRAERVDTELARLIDGGVFPGLSSNTLRRLHLHAVGGRMTPAQRAALFTWLAVATHDHSETAEHLLPYAVEHARAAVRVAPDGDVHLPQYLVLLATLLLDSADRTRTAPGWRKWLVRPSIRPLAGADADQAEAVTVLERAVAEAAEPGHAYWAMAGIELARLYRRLGRDSDSRTAGLTALRGHAWRVLLQSHTPAAAAAVGRAVTDAMLVARWHCEDGDAEGAALALDACRGLILHSANEFRDVPTRLTAAGATDLAQAWREHPGRLDDVPTALRRATLDHLTGPRRLLDPPPLPEVRTALRTLGADALIYLIPGTAVLLPASGPARIVPLPELGTPPSPGTDWPEAATRDLGAPGGSPVLDAVCDWAWPAFAAPILTRFADLDRPPRLILVPMGDLARVPWHAAHHESDGYALERAVFSYAPSARLLCSVAARLRPQPDPAPVLLVADPPTSAPPLPAARAEAQALLALYPEAHRLGRLPSPDGLGRPQEILDWLATHPGGRLHLGCHGTVVLDAPEESSYLLLAADERLTAEHLLTAPAINPAMVVLAACNTAVSGRGYDEAFSLSTTFLTAGAATVIAAQWNLPDEATATLMLRFHEALRTEPPADALRTAQLQLLDHPLTHWAGVIHLGR